MMKRKLLLMVLLALWLAAAKNSFAGNEQVLQGRAVALQSHLLNGINKHLNMETAAAELYLKKAIETEPDNSIGYAFKAMLHMFSYEMCFTLEQREREKEALLRHAQDALALGEKMIAKNPNDSQAYLALALAKIAKVYWAIKEKRYFMMAQESANIWNYLALAKTAEPDICDIDFLMGLLRYHIDHLPGATRFLSSLFLTEGNKQKGMQEIQMAAQKGILLRDIAQAETAFIYLYFEEQPQKALHILRDLRKKYPQNYNFAFGQGLALAESKKFDEALAVAAEIEKNINANFAAYVRELQPRHHLLMGRIFFKKEEYEKAESFFQKILPEKAFYNSRTQARALLYLGMIADLRRERRQAEYYYARIQELEGAGEAVRKEARGYIKTPYKKSI